MKKIIAITLSLIFILSSLTLLTITSSASAVDLYTPAKDGEILFIADFKGMPGEWEPALLSGTPVVTPSEKGDSMTIITTNDKTASYWGGWIQTLPLNETTRYTIYYTVTRTNKDSVGVYCDSVYGAYGYAARSKLMNKGSSFPGQDYVYYDKVGIDAPTAADGETLTQEFALEVNGTNKALTHYIKDKTGKYVEVADTGYDAISAFNSEVLGLFFYTYYAAHSSTISNVSIVKGLAFGTYETPTATTPAETTAKPAETTAKPAETTAKPAETTAKPTETTAKPATTTAAPADNGGCGGAIMSSVALIPMVIAGAIIIRKKRD